MPEMKLKPGTLATVTQEEDGQEVEKEVLIIELLEERAGDAVVTYNYKMEPITVADYNEEYDCDPDDHVARVVYIESLSQIYPNWEKRSLSFIRDHAESGDVRSYSFPFCRLDPARVAFDD